MPPVSRAQVAWAKRTGQPFAKEWAAAESTLPAYAPTSDRIFHPKHKAVKS